MRISDWSSDVCSSDLTPEHNFGPAALSNGIKVTPLARRLAAERSIDLATVAGSGPNGRIVADDIRDAEPPVLQVSAAATSRSEEHTSELQSLMRISYAVLRLKQKKEYKTYELKQILL